MSNTDDMIHFGAYLVAKEDFCDSNNELICTRGELALIFSRHRSAAGKKPVDIMFERGSTFHGILQDSIRRHFLHLYTDSDFVICGCSANDGWNSARQVLQNLDTNVVAFTMIDSSSDGKIHNHE